MNRFPELIRLSSSVGFDDTTCDGSILRVRQVSRAFGGLMEFRQGYLMDDFVWWVVCLSNTHVLGLLEAMSKGSFHDRKRVCIDGGGGSSRME
jgi:hypothetical protein